MVVENQMNVLVEAKHGRMLVNKNDVYIGRSIREFGEFSEGEVEVFQQLLRPGCMVVEAGANIGTHTIPLAKAVGPTGRVFAFEPQRIVHQTLCANVALNSLTNVVADWAGVSDQAGELHVPPIDYSVQQNFGGINLQKFTQGERVPLKTIDSLELPRLELLKADVEGMELAVLKGAQETIQRCKPTLYLECDRKDKAPELISYIYSLGYEPYWHRPPMFNAKNFFNNAENPFGSIVSINVLAVHPERKIVIQGMPKVELQVTSA